MILQTELYNEARQRLAELKKVQATEYQRIKKYPDGKIHIVKKGKSIAFYLRSKPSDKSGKYICKSQPQIIRQYVQKEYDEKAFKMISNEVERLEVFLKDFDGCYEEICNLYSGFPEEAKQYLNPIVLPYKEYSVQWSSVPFEKLGIAVDYAELVTQNGEHVRSKSELTIANMLKRNGLVYRYECPLILKGNKKVYPDFMILNKRTREIIIWEHRGMMDDIRYARDAVIKIKEYEKNNYVLGRNLIITEETSTSPLSTTEIQRMIDTYLI